MSVIGCCDMLQADKRSRSRRPIDTGEDEDTRDADAAAGERMSMLQPQLLFPCHLAAYSSEVAPDAQGASLPCFSHGTHTYLHEHDRAPGKHKLMQLCIAFRRSWCTYGHTSAWVQPWYRRASYMQALCNEHCLTRMLQGGPAVSGLC